MLSVVYALLKFENDTALKRKLKAKGVKTSRRVALGLKRAHVRMSA